VTPSASSRFGLIIGWLSVFLGATCFAALPAFSAAVLVAWLLALPAAIAARSLGAVRIGALGICVAILTAPTLWLLNSVRSPEYYFFAIALGVVLFGATLGVGFLRNRHRARM
jgi:hypothetical protein